MKVLRVMMGMVKNKKLPPYADGSLYFVFLTTVNRHLPTVLLSDQFDTAFFFLGIAAEFVDVLLIRDKHTVKPALACTCRYSLTDDHVLFQAFEEVLFSRDRGR